MFESFAVQLSAWTSMTADRLPPAVTFLVGTAIPCSRAEGVCVETGLQVPNAEVVTGTTVPGAAPDADPAEIGMGPSVRARSATTPRIPSPSARLLAGRRWKNRVADPAAGLDADPIDDPVPTSLPVCA